jgi:low affinity Fe/Cu permease
MSTRMGWMERFARFATAWTGSTSAFVLAATVVIAWAATGPVFDYSENWQLIINTGTTIVTFLMVFLIQRGQNKESLSIQLKLNEIVAAIQGASNRLINVEDLSEDEIELLHDHYRALSNFAKRDYKLTESHSVEEAEDRHLTKHHARSKAGAKS